MINIPLVERDIHGIKTTNWITDEKVMLSDKTLPWIVPNGAPFFAEQALFKLYNAAGGELVVNRDYFFEEEFQPLCAVTGRSICCFVRLETTVLESNAFVTLNYQSIGESYVPRNDLDEWIHAIMSGGKSIPFSKVVNIPTTLPSSYHLHSIKTEVGDWYEVTDFLNLLANMQNGVDPTLNTQVTMVRDTLIPAAKTTYRSRMAVLVEHDKNYENPHQTNKTHLDLGNVDNFGTASLFEDAAGTRQDLFSTPAGVIQLVKGHVPDSNSLMLQGVMPISQYAGNSYIPPAISGSFEGMGGMTDASGICLERNGDLAILSNHMDGRVDGLYYSIVRDYNKPTASHLYTQFKYEPPSLKAIGITPNRIIAGSGNKVIMVGVAGTSDWYISLTDGTFDPGYHSFVKCDMTAVETALGVSPYDADWKATIHHMGDYLVLVQSYHTANGIYGNIVKQRFFRVSTNDVRNRLPVTWQAIKLTFTDYDGNAYSNVDEFVMVKPSAIANNRFTKFGPWTLAQPAQASWHNPRYYNLSHSRDGQPGVFDYHVIFRTALAYQETGQFIAFYAVYEAWYEFTPATGVFTLKGKQPPETLDFFGSSAERSKVTDRYLYITPATNTSEASGSLVVLETGELVQAFVNRLTEDFPIRIWTSTFTGITSPSALLNRLWDTITSPMVLTQMNPVIQPPIANGNTPSGVIYEPDGELFTAVTPANSSVRAVFFRKVVGDYAIRPEVNNLQLGDLYSRPLSNAVYKANMNVVDGAIGITGTDAELTAGGVPQGSTSLSMCSYTSYYGVSGYVPVTPEFRAPASGNVLMSFPRTHAKTFDEVNKTVTYTATSFYGFRQAVFDKIKSFIPGAYASTPYWGFNLYVLGSENGGMFTGLNMALISIDFIDSANRKYRTKFLSATLVVEAPNADHPGVYLITDFTPLSQPGDVRAAEYGVNTAEYQYARTDFMVIRPRIYGYRNGTTMKVSLRPGYFMTTDSGWVTSEGIFDLNLTTGAISNIASGGKPVNIYKADLTIMIPRLGMSDITLVANAPETTRIDTVFDPYKDSGAAACIFRKTVAAGDVRYFLTGSVYPATGWTFTIPDGVELLINGAPYTASGKTFDLQEVTPDPANKTFYLYVTLEGTIPKYILTTERLRKTLVMMRVAILTTNDRQIVTIEREQPTMVGDYLISFIREGGVIPVSSGFPQDEGDFFIFDYPELLT